jgi:hypothetical protein
VCEVACLSKERQNLAHALKIWVFGISCNFQKLFFPVSHDFLAIFAFTQVEQDKNLTPLQQPNICNGIIQC